MSDNSLKISFDYKKPDEPTLIVYKTFSSGYLFGSEPTIGIVKTYVGREALDLYVKLSGKDVNDILKEAQNGI